MHGFIKYRSIIFRKTSLLFFIILFLCFIFFSCADNKDLIPQKTIITGQVINSNYSEGNNTIEFYHADLISSGVEKIVEFDSTGCFRWETEIAHTHNLYIEYFDEVIIFINPGDSVFIRIDAERLRQDSLSTDEYYSCFSITGTSEDLNKEMTEFMVFYVDSIQDVRRDDNYMILASLEDYKDIIINQIRRQSNLLDQYFLDHKNSQEFKDWAYLKVKFKGWYNLIYYTWYHPYRNGKDMFEFQKSIPNNYYSFLDNWDKDNRNYISVSEYLRFLNEYYTVKSIFSIQEDTLQVFRKDSINGRRDRFEYQIQQIRNSEKGILKDILIAKMYNSYIEQKNYEVLKYHDNTEFIEDDYLRSRIRDGINIMKEEYNAIQCPDGINIKDVDTKDCILQNLKTKFPDKGLYIIFWSPTCGACLKKVPNSNAIKPILEEEDVVIVFLASNCNESSWQNAIEKYNIQGEHLLLTKVQYGELFNLYNFKAIPYYLLIDKDGRIIQKNAPSPSEELLKLIKDNK